ncbi:MAG: hypothetical protein ACRDND_12985 [Streptosporangiaceae bacterium]
MTSTRPATATGSVTAPRLGRDRATRHRRLGRLAALVVGVFLLPWCAVLGATLPASTVVPNWSLAWVGLDLAEAVAALLTAVLLTRGSPRAGLPATAGAALLLADAWFDVCTSPPGLDRLLAVGEAVLVELPLAAAAIWLAVALTRDTGRGRPEHARYRDGGRTRLVPALSPAVGLCGRDAEPGAREPACCPGP